MHKLFIIILIFIQLTLTEPHKSGKDQIVSLFPSHKKPEALSAYYFNRKSPEKQSVDSSKDLRKIIFNKFNKINYDFMDKSHRETFNDLIVCRLIRSVKRRDISCTLSKEKLLEVNNQINEAISQASTESNVCDSSELDSGNCVQWLKLIKCSVNCLKNGMKEATSSKAPIDEINKWDVVYKRIIYSYEQEGEITRDSFSNEQKEQFDSLGGDLQAAERVIGDLKRETKNSKMKMCIENISNGNIENAIEYFQQIKKNSALIDIITSAYVEHGQLQNLKNIIDFGSALTTCSQNKIVCLTLYDLMKEKNQLNTPHVMIFLKGTKRCMKNTTIEASLKSRTDTIIELWSNSIRSSNYSYITNFTKLNGQGHDIREYYPEIIEKAYAQDLKNAKAIFKFIWETPHIEDECVCLVSLFQNMKNNNNLNSNELLILALRLKLVMRTEKYLAAKDYFKKLSESLKNSFYTSVKNLIWNGENCTIRSKDWNEYLYSASSEWNYDSDRRRAFTWRKGGPEFIEGFWNINPEEDGQLFTIKNNHFKEYLYAAAASFAYDDERRSVFTWVPGNIVIQSFWTITPLNDGEDFVINNKYMMEYLYAASNYWAEDSERRRVFTWRGKDQDKISSDMIWQIDCKTIEN